MARDTTLLQGTLDLLILKTLTLEELHGLGIARRVEQVTRGVFLVKPGPLFPALHRREAAGWLSSVWGQSESGRKARFYRLTRAGRRQLKSATGKWGRAPLAMALALEA